MTSFNTGGAFSGGEANGLRGGIEAAMKVMGQSAQPNYMPTEVKITLSEHILIKSKRKMPQRTKVLLRLKEKL